MYCTRKAAPRSNPSRWPDAYCNGVAARLREPPRPAPQTTPSQRGVAPPGCLVRGMQALTGIDLQGVRVHYNSPLPATIQAHAYARGLDIYLAPGQEHHLPHELAHVVQQLRGMVVPTTTVGDVPINDDPALEAQADDWGRRAMRACSG